MGLTLLFKGVAEASHFLFLPCNNPWGRFWKHTTYVVVSSSLSLCLVSWCDMIICIYGTCTKGSLKITRAKTHPFISEQRDVSRDNLPTYFWLWCRGDFWLWLSMSPPVTDFLRQRVRVNSASPRLTSLRRAPCSTGSRVEHVSGSTSCGLMLPFKERDTRRGPIPFFRIADLLFSSAVNGARPYYLSEPVSSLR